MIATKITIKANPISSSCPDLFWIAEEIFDF